MTKPTPQAEGLIHLFNNRAEPLLVALPRIRKALAATPGARLYQTARGLIVTAATPKRGWFELKLARDMEACASPGLAAFIHRQRQRIQRAERERKTKSNQQASRHAVCSHNAERAKA